MKDLILKDWSWIRVARLLFGLFFVFKAFSTHETIYIIVSAVLLYQVFFNIKCITGTCPDNNCTIDSEQHNKQNK